MQTVFAECIKTKKVREERGCGIHCFLFLSFILFLFAVYFSLKRLTMSILEFAGGDQFLL